MRAKEYKILYDGEFCSLDEKVNEYLNDGWELLGPPVFHNHGLAQAMFLPINFFDEFGSDGPVPN